MNGTGTASLKKSLHYGYGVRVAYMGHDLHGLRLGPDGRLYFSIGNRGLQVQTEHGLVSNPDSGAVLRCNLDGSGLEVFAAGLRNPQELAFDEPVNLFTVDNNSDADDKARCVYFAEGGDSGWRVGWQFINTPVQRGLWMSEKIWELQNDEQPAYSLPPVAHISDGRFSGGSHGFVVGHVTPEAYVGGPIALVKNGDPIIIDAEKRQMTMASAPPT